MKSKKGSIVAFVLILAVLAACAYVSISGVGSGKQGSAQNIKLGLDLAGGVSITYEADQNNPSSEDMTDTIYKLQKRVEVYSTDAEVYQEGTNRINVEIPGVFDAEEVLNTLGNPGSIGFYEQVSVDDYDGDLSEAEAESGYVLNQVLSGDDVVDAQAKVQTGAYGGNEYVVALTFTSEGAKKFEEATARNIKKPIYIIYDNEIISYPEVQSTISTGEAVINGNFDYASADSLATTIRLGKLKLELHEVRSNVVGAKLGEEAMNSSLMAGLIGIVFIVIFLIVVFRLPGVASSIALILYVFVMLCFLNALDVTLTLPGIAGIILSIGMAVDANVVIFARVKEEIAEGNGVHFALKTGFSKATSAIVDGNITTLIAAAVLYIMGSGTIKGFATTLALGIVLSMFTAMIVTRMLIFAFYGMGLKNEKLYGRARSREIIGFVQKRLIYFILSILVIGAGFAGMAMNNQKGEGALNYSLDFTGGTSMTVSFAEKLDVTGEAGSDLRALIEENAGVTDIQLQNVEGTSDVIIKTPVLESDQRSKLRAALVQTYDVDESGIEEQSISAVVSGEMRQDAFVSVAVAAALMLIYIWIRFRDVRFGFSAVLALLHDVLVVLTVYALVRIPVGNTFIACMLTIVGYSINATIVIFDRIRENMKSSHDELENVVNLSITQTMTRSVYTSLTTLVMVVVLYILGVSSIKEFALPLIAGILCGAYSSVCLVGSVWYIMKRRLSRQQS